MTSADRSDRSPLQIAITTGEPAGVGPELTAMALAGAAAHWPHARFVVFGDAGLMAARAGAVGVDWAALTAGGEAGEARVRVEHRPLAVSSVAGKLDAANGRYVLGLLDDAIDGAVAGKLDAIVTAPLQKSTINDAGVPFTGHTEYLAERTHTARVVMMLAGTGARPLRVALATTHLPLRDVSAALTVDGLLETLAIIDHDLRRDFSLPVPRILVTGLNPHAGENGYLGREEIDVITPALEQAARRGIDARGPYPADTLFQPRYLEQADCVLAMFHDQGLPVLKYATFGEGVNITLGLPIIRTSVDHGTALDLAGTGRADAGSLIAAIDTAVSMARNRRGN
ncbi:4-hydroxythreonine-4-phosphate dehydrogenase PdxA [Trinickia caryophylli]|uniref:4-hydroxythreonine-4-phosphate dehydrogenase n=1 Tax=Trinickia caryophylli TaxID=28094 RepID=A0A1X7ETG8_TRICW|nr:4-hydroxythreonine-4-phosphate dehydrogenase PdxA [Trinickia caryophylli]PMS12127.1 4-hydroxythreonine-4-phosphate dehydrogenase PdxA [Trinickia caryophylli]TRX18565.1 4-hydroxythreonine-4-phosphate dehydrogenase PdxA [Trinickia caryophylli]WQE10642.1 4-hydroxythreonine-4-phosphate dehydrogenase PdxA [Trinickia caryophylli]SMF39651.1 4-hydroxythreonine-4-phosphate dehydrogenase [Trinickia caryophylli]GLU33009.1 4-hydroxythreonine-4-phosphate dehydrogenase [Trinickia caryophylli]